MDKVIELKLNEIVRKISKIKSVSVIFLFGSQINGRARQDSDIDIAILTKNSSEDDEWKIVGNGNDKFEIHLFNKLPLIIQFRVIGEGKLLFVRNERYLYETRFKVIKYYLDFSCFINKFYLKAIENA